MNRRIVRLLFEIAILILALWCVVFLVLQVIALDPARALLGPYASAEQIEELRRQLGLDRPLLLRLIGSLRQYLTFDYGDSLYYHRSAATIVGELAPLTLGRALLGTVLGAGAALLLLVALARFRLRTLARIFAVVFSLPNVVVLVIALLIAARVFGVTPLAHRGIYEGIAVIACALYPFGAVGAFAAERLAVHDAIKVDFLRSIGLAESLIRLVLMREGLPAALAVAVNSFVIALTATTIAEVVFNLPGFGIVFVRSCERADFPVIIAGSSLLGILLIVAHRVADAASTLADERLRNSPAGLEPRGRLT